MACDPKYAIYNLETWPDCATTDCPNKVCTWSLLPSVCSPCGELVLGHDAMVARFNETHDKTWDECHDETQN